MILMGSISLTMIYAKLETGREVPVSLIRWTPAGAVQVRRDRVVGGPTPQVVRIFGVYFPATVMQLRHDAGRAQLARTLASLPRPATPAARTAT